MTIDLGWISAKIDSGPPSEWRFYRNLEVTELKLNLEMVTIMPFKLKSNNRTSNKMTKAKGKFHPSCCPKMKWYRVFMRIFD